MNRRRLTVLAAIPATLIVGATAASAAVGWHSSGIGNASVVAGTWVVPASGTLTCSGLTSFSATISKAGPGTTCTLTVKNTSGAAETITLSPGTFDGSPHALSQSLAATSIPLAAGASTTDLLTIGVQSSTTQGAQHATVTANVGGTVVATLTETITVTP
jgi:hypothetical protein